MLSLITQSALLLAVVGVCYALFERYGRGLSGVPGPITSSWSNLPRFAAVYRHSVHRWNRRLHEKYGRVVRIGPTHVSFASMSALHDIHACRDALPKSDFYGADTIANQPLYKGHRVTNLFLLRDVERHSKLKRSLSGLYTKTAIEPFESHVDEAVMLLVDRLGAVVRKSPGPLNVADWLHFYSFDSLCAINVSKRFGFLDAGKDINGILGFADAFMARFALFAQLPKVNQALRLWSLRKGPILNPFHKYVIGVFEQRLEKPTGQHDMLNAFLRLHEQHPGDVSHAEIVGAIYVNLMAGHDVLAISLRAIFYFLARNPDVQAKLRAEILSQTSEYNMSNPIPDSVDSKMPYLQAVIYESHRMHPNTGTILERTVPAGGMSIDGYWLPQGTTVGCNAWLIHRDQQIFGHDVDVFRPQRWIEAPADKMADMKRAIFSFGAGPRLCIGRNIAWLQMNKAVVELVRRFSFKMAEPTREWHVNGTWITKQSDMDMLVEAV